MRKHTINNVRAIHNYCEFLREAKRLSDVSVDGVTKAINRFEVYTKYKDF
ncbi:site-specific integrase, partial [Vibrio anguillarum]|nr:site-specific integrase [Vibrio anguillarum]